MHCQRDRQNKSGRRSYKKELSRPDNNIFKLQLYFPCKFHHRGRVGDDAHDEDGSHDAAGTAPTDLYHKDVYTTIPNNVLGLLNLFLSSKSLIVTMIEKSGHILLLSSKYHAKAARGLFSIFFPKFDLCLKPCLQDPQNRSQIKNPPK